MAEARRARRIAVVVPEGVSAQTVPLQVERIAERMVTGDRDVCRRLNRDSRRIPEDAIGPDPRPVSAREVEDPERPVVDRPIVEDDIARRPQTDADPPVVVDRDVATDGVARRASVTDLDAAGVGRQVAD